MAAVLCVYHQYGHCRYQARCRNRHIDAVCEDMHCEITNCERRHPLSCKYFETFGRCRFNPCSYAHVAATNFTSVNSETVANLEKQKKLNLKSKI